MRFILDEGIHPQVASIAWELGLDVVSVHEIRRRGLSDYDQLRLAAEDGRVLVTRNRGDYVFWTGEFFRAGDPHAGLLLVETGLPNDQPDRIARALKRWVYAHGGGGEEEVVDVGFGPYHIDVLSR